MHGEPAVVVGAEREARSRDGLLARAAGFEPALLGGGFERAGAHASDQRRGEQPAQEDRAVRAGTHPQQDGLAQQRTGVGQRFGGERHAGAGSG